MRKLFHSILKKQFHEALVHSREKEGATQLKMAQILCMDERSYIDLDHGKTCCSAITLALFLIYVREDVDIFLGKLRSEIESVSDNAA